MTEEGREANERSLGLSPFMKEKLVEKLKEEVKRTET